ncbi:MAG: RNA methyltransferase [Deltaproteobacteria bacterium]|nr:RNA methyltransferase [Deltaproteobacteria bacterium]
MNEVNLERRIKRWVWAPEHAFFAMTAPGLEELAAQELACFTPERPLVRVGGVSFRGRLEVMYRANLCLATAGRIWLRLRDFRVRGWDDLLRQAAGVPWELYLPPGGPVALTVTLKDSNLRHSGRVAEELRAAQAARLRGLGLQPPVEAPLGDPDAFRVAVRGEERRATISLDASGEHLHRRGYRLETGRAPLREDLAAALLHLAGYDGQETLLDSMCGAGTLAVEAALIARRLAPGGQRSMGFQAWPSFRRPAWEHLLRQAAAAARPSAPSPILARDLDPRALEAAQGNAARAGVAGDIAFAPGDFFQAAPPPGPPGLVVLNPPYGRRLGSVRQAERLLQEIGEHLRRAYAGWRVGLVLYRPEWAQGLPLRDTARLVVPHGGLTVTLLTGRVGG